MKPTYFDVTGNSDNSGSAFVRVQDPSRPKLRGIIVDDDTQRYAEKALIQELQQRTFKGGSYG